MLALAVMSALLPPLTAYARALQALFAVLLVACGGVCVVLRYVLERTQVDA